MTRMNESIPRCCGSRAACRCAPLCSGATHFKRTSGSRTVLAWISMKRLRSGTQFSALTLHPNERLPTGHLLIADALTEEGLSYVGEVIPLGACYGLGARSRSTAQRAHTRTGMGASICQGRKVPACGAGGIRAPPGNEPGRGRSPETRGDGGGRSGPSRPNPFVHGFVGQASGLSKLELSSGFWLLTRYPPLPDRNSVPVDRNSVPV